MPAFAHRVNEYRSDRARPVLVRIDRTDLRGGTAWTGTGVESDLHPRLAAAAALVAGVWVALDFWREATTTRRSTVARALQQLPPTHGGRADPGTGDHTPALAAA